MPIVSNNRFAILLYFFWSYFLSADVYMPGIFGDHMVLQQGEPIVVWGKASRSETVTVIFGGSSHGTVADSIGNWSVSLPARSANAVGQYMTIRGKNEIVFKDVLIGEVWLCSGQSNMAMIVAKSMDAKAEISLASHPMIRQIAVGRIYSSTPQEDILTKGWNVCTPKTAGSFTAVGFYFARRLQEKLNVPIGLISSNWGGTRIEPWIPLEGYNSVLELEPLYPLLYTDPLTLGSSIKHQDPLAIQNAMIAPLVPYRIRGVLWYQGEANVGDGMLYHHKMRALINGWRTIWDRPELPFYYVQLTPFGHHRDKTLLPELWQSQLHTLTIPNTGMAVTTDINPTLELHPPNKQAVGHRLALWALSKTYGYRNMAYTGPLFSKVQQQENELIVHFQKGSAEGLRLICECDETKLFEISGEDNIWTSAEARIEGNSVILTSPDVLNPSAARYSWDQMATASLFNGDRLPASPFTSRLE